MKSCFNSAAILLAMMSGMTEAVEHPLLQSTDDFRETWKERPVKSDMISM